MSISVFPVPSTATGPDAKVFQIAAAYTSYEINDTFGAGGYTVTTSPSTSQVNIKFTNASSILANDTTVDGTVSFSIASDATELYITDTSGATSTTVTITYTSVNASGAALSGTLDTITTTSTYNQVGLIYPLVVGAGGGGGGGSTSSYGGGGGGGGAITGVITYANTATSITIGALGAGGVNTQGPGTSGGATSFGNILTANGGLGGGVPGASYPDGGNGGTFTGGIGSNGGAGSQANQGNAEADANGGVTINKHLSVTAGNSGGGGGGMATGAGTQTGGGSGIGTGGSGGKGGGPTAIVSNAATGYGAGGGGGGASNTSNFREGAAGSPGVVYVLRGF